MSITKPSLPKGTRDFSPVEMVKRNYIYDTIKTVFKKYGYAEIQTPSMENLQTLTGKYGDLLDFVMIIVVIFYILTIYGIFILRRKMPNAERPYKAFGYPVIPFIYIIVATAICVSLLITKTSTCGWGVVIMLIGIPVYYLTKPKEEQD